MVVVGFCVTMSLIKLMNNFESQKNLKNILNQAGIVSSNIEFVEYMRRRLPYGSFHNSFGQLFDKNDSYAIHESKTEYIKSLKQFKLSMTFATIAILGLVAVIVQLYNNYI